MIIPDENLKGPSQPPHLYVDASLPNDTSLVGGSGIQPIPPGLSSGDDQGLPPYTPRETDPLLPNVERSSSLKRAGRSISLVVQALLFSVVAGFVVVLIVFRRTSPRRHEISAVCHYADTWTALNQTQNDFHHVTTDLDLPITLDSLQFVSGCRDCIVNAIIQPSSDDHDMNMRIHLSAKHHNLTQLHQMKLCHTIFSNNTMSTFLQALSLPLGSSEPYFLEVLITFPRNESVDGIKLMKDFIAVFASSTTLTVSDLMSQVRFGTFVIVAEDGDMSVHGVNTGRALINTGRGSVDAHFHAGEYVKITSQNSFVKLNATMSRTTKNTPEVQVRASGPTQVNVNLEDTSGTDSRPLELAIYAYSSTDQVELGILDIPVESLVHAVAHAERGSVTMSLPPSFEGTLDMRHGPSADIYVDNDMADPKRQGRRRQVIQERIHDHQIVGRTWWEASDRTKCRGGCPGNNLDESQASEEKRTSVAYIVAKHGSATLNL